MRFGVRVWRICFASAAILLAAQLAAPAEAGDPTTQPAPDISQPATRPAHKPAKRDSAAHDAELAELTSGDEARVAASIAGITKEARKHINQAQFLKVIAEAKLYPQAEEAARQLIIGRPSATMSVDGLQRFLATALLADGKTDEALAAAKGYYNVCLLKNTSDAIDLVALCLARARPHEADIVHEFKLQQITGASTQPAVAPSDAANAPASTINPSMESATAPADTTLGNPDQSILASIPIDPKPYEQAIDGINPVSYAQFAAKGNLLLLSGRTKEARELFQQSADLAPEKSAAEAIENVARALRAESGCVGPANAYILKMRSAEQ